MLQQLGAVAALEAAQSLNSDLQLFLLVGEARENLFALLLSFAHHSVSLLLSLFDQFSLSLLALCHVFVVNLLCHGEQCRRILRCSRCRGGLCGCHSRCGGIGSVCGELLNLTLQSVTLGVECTQFDNELVQEVIDLVAVVTGLFGHDFEALSDQVFGGDCHGLLLWVSLRCLVMKLGAADSPAR